ncbi:uncharacterized protein LOC126909634 isoform X2 [Daktulosphaira vitifoliae]|uniref:uncharacterized protein LOC126909634 isoform X2 n=1 Tax=Daktulosphaira vitifoliae TaxID=58002 RepID=UPI0021AB006E|nr:uncharacterized protein LOC126909634 isoform X2 [Daktulosphaira vitifoliae]
MQQNYMKDYLNFNKEERSESCSRNFNNLKHSSTSSKSESSNDSKRSDETIYLLTSISGQENSVTASDWEDKRLAYDLGYNMHDEWASKVYYWLKDIVLKAEMSGNSFNGKNLNQKSGLKSFILLLNISNIGVLQPNSINAISGTTREG